MLVFMPPLRGSATIRSITQRLRAGLLYAAPFRGLRGQVSAYAADAAGFLLSLKRAYGVPLVNRRAPSGAPAPHFQAHSWIGKCWSSSAARQRLLCEEFHAVKTMVQAETAPLRSRLCYAGGREPARQALGRKLGQQKALRMPRCLRDPLGGGVAAANRAFHGGRPAGGRPVAGLEAIGEGRGR